ncbi:MAG: hypothetical protein AAFT19_03635 [Pseudomonadota bacterium]
MRTILSILALAALAACQSTQERTVAGPADGLVEGQTYVLAALPVGDEALHAFCARPGTRYVITARPGKSLSDVCGGRDALALTAEGAGRFRYVEDGLESRGEALSLDAAAPDGHSLMLYATPPGRFAHFASRGAPPPGDGTGAVTGFDLARGRVNLVGALSLEDGRLVSDRLTPAAIAAALEEAGRKDIAAAMVEARPAIVQARCQLGESPLFGTAPVECIYTEFN